MDIKGLGWRTDLALLEISGSVLDDRGDHVVVRTPDNPTFWWGNFLMLAGPPADAADARRWIGAFEAEFPAAPHALAFVTALVVGRVMSWLASAGVASFFAQSVGAAIPTLVATLDKDTKVQAGASAKFVIDTDRIHIFDADTEAAIR